MIISDRPLLTYSGFAWKIAFTVAFLSIGKVHTFVSSVLQGLPVHFTKEEPSPAVAVRVTGAFRMYCSSQSPGQFMRPSPLVTVPVAPFFKIVTTLSMLGPWKTALTDFFLSMVTLQVRVVPSHPREVGFQPIKVERSEGVAVRVTKVSGLYGA